MRLIMLIVFLAAAAAVYPQTYKMVPVGDGTWKLETIAQAPVITTSTFAEGIQVLRNAEGISPTAIVTILEDPANPRPMVPCSSPSEIVPCSSAGVIVQ